VQDLPQQPDPDLDPRELGQRNARFTYAQRRIQKIVDGAPPLSSEQRARLAAILAPVSHEAAA
jgi:hypothetical protein